MSAKNDYGYIHAIRRGLSLLISASILFSSSFTGAQSAAPLWRADVFYSTGQIVSYDGRTWLAEFDNIGITPSGLGQIEWKETGVSEESILAYDPKQIYDAGALVVFDSAIWRSFATHVGERPGDSSVWSYVRAYEGEEISEEALGDQDLGDGEVIAAREEAAVVQQWSATQVYLANSGPVRYKNLRWVVQDDLLSPPFGVSPVSSGCYWALDGVPTGQEIPSWQERSSYGAGDVVSYAGYLWFSLSAHIAVEPGQNGQVWLALQPDLTVVQPWQVGQPVRLGDVRAYAQQYWISATGSSDEAPGTGVSGGQDWLLYAPPTERSPLFQIKFSGEFITPIGGLLYGLDGRFWVTSGTRTELENPLVDQTGWVALDAAIPVNCELLANQAAGVKLWDPRTVYDTVGTVVRYGNDYYYSISSVFSSSPPSQDTLSWRIIANNSAVLLSVQGDQQWERYKTYNFNSRVLYGGRVWVAQYANNGAAPGSAPVWQPAELVSGEEWNTNFIYASQQIVSFNGQLWRNRYYSQGKIPGASQDWELVNAPSSPRDSVIADNLAWNPNTNYPSNRKYIVVYNGRQWYNTRQTKGDIPGQSDAWQPKTILPEQDWNKYFIYANPGIVVSHSDSLWKNKWWTQGEEPGESQVWSPIDSGSGSDPNAWNQNLVYSKPGTVVTHLGRTWKNQWWTQGNAPGTNAVWQPTAIISEEAWNPYFIYSVPNTRVSHGGKIWANQWWTQGQEPGVVSVWLEQ